MEQNFLETPLYKSFEKEAEKNIEHWPCIMQDCLESELLNRGVDIKLVALCINAATKKFKQDHKAEIEESWKRVLKETNTTYDQVLEVQAAINAQLREK